MLDYLLSVIIWASVFASLFVGALVYLRNRRGLVNISFFLLAFIGAVWAIGLFFFQHPFFLSSEIWLRFVYFIVLFLLGLFFNFSFVFPQKINKAYLLPMLIYGVSAVVFAYLILFTRLFLFSVTATYWGYQQILGPAYPFFGIWAGFFTLWSVFNFYNNYQKVHGLEKVQMKFLFFGCFFFGLIPIVLDVIFPLVLHNSQFIWFSPIATAFFVGFTGYAIIKHRFLNIRLLVARLVVYTLLLLTLGLTYISLIFILSNIIFPKIFSENYLVFTSVLALFACLSFQSLRKLFEKMTDKIFFKNQYKTDDLLRIASKAIASSINLEILTQNILKLVIEKVRISKAAFIILKKDGISVVSSDRDGFTFSQEELDQLKSKTSLIINEEVKDEKTKQLLSSHEISILSPLKAEEKLVGFLLLADKLSGETYFEEDIKVLEILAPQIAIAIQNAQAYEEIQQFSFTLKEEIDKATKELKSANERLKELSVLKDEFVSIASHELRTPMTAIKSYLWLVLNKGTKLNEKTRKYLQIAYASTERTITLVRDMLTVSRIEGRRLDVNMVVFDIREIVSQTYDDLKFKADEKKIKFDLEKFGSSLMVKADKDKIREVLQNLIANALKFTHAGGKVSIAFYKAEGAIEISVTDTGPGIAKSDLPKLFQKFGRLGNSFSKMAETQGTGLGLYIAKQIVSLHGGKIWVESKEGQGSTFTFSLPEAKEEK